MERTWIDEKKRSAMDSDGRAYKSKKGDGRRVVSLDSRHICPKLHHSFSLLVASSVNLDSFQVNEASAESRRHGAKVHLVWTFVEEMLSGIAKFRRIRGRGLKVRTKMSIMDSSFSKGCL